MDHLLVDAPNCTGLYLSCAMNTYVFAVDTDHYHLETAIDALSEEEAVEKVNRLFYHRAVEGHVSADEEGTVWMAFSSGEPLTAADIDHVEPAYEEDDDPD